MLQRVEPDNSARYTLDSLRQSEPEASKPAAIDIPSPPEFRDQPERWRELRSEMNAFDEAVGRGWAMVPSHHPSGRPWMPGEPRRPRHLTEGYYDSPREEWLKAPAGLLGPDPGSAWLWEGRGKGSWGKGEPV